MSFLLNIRHGLNDAEDHFGSGDVRQFKTLPVRIGSEEGVECRLEDLSVGGTHLVLSEGKMPSRVMATPYIDENTFLNEQPLTEATEIRSGDEIRIAHWTIRFHKLYGATATGKRANLLALAAKVGVVMLLALEMTVVLWVPQQARKRSLWRLQSLRLANALLLDGLRDKVRGMSPQDELAKAITAAVSTDLDARAKHLRTYQDQMGIDQHVEMKEKLQDLGTILTRVEQGVVVQPMPELETKQIIETFLSPDKPK